MELEQVDCPVCGPSRSILWLNGREHTCYVRCVECDTVYASPRLEESFRHSNLDTVWTYSPDLLTRESLRLPVLRQVANHIQELISCGRMLDVGCSSGDFFTFFPDPAWEKFGIELSATAAAYAARAHGAQVIAGTLRSAQWPDDSFDVVSMIDVMYLVDDPRAEMDEVRRILKPGGLVAIEITGQAYMFFRSRGLITLLVERRWCRLDPVTHLYWFTPAGLRRLLEKSGLEPFAWHITRSQLRANPLSNLVSTSYFHLYSALAGNSLNMLNWAPKYLCLARRVESLS